MSESAPVSVEQTRGKTGLREFVRLPFELYRDDPCWVPPVRRIQMQLFDSGHPFHEHGEVTTYLARRDGRAVGRIAAIVNHAHNEYHGERTGFFGFLEAGDDQEVFAALLGAAERRLAEAGMESCRGPMEFSTNEECGLLVKGFDGPPMVMMPYNPPWYLERLEECGYRKVIDLYAYRLVDDGNRFERLGRVAAAVLRRPGVSVRNLSVRHISRDIPVIMDIYNECWRRNWGFVPMTERELDAMADELKLILRPSLAPIVEVDGEPVAFAVALPDANQAFMRARGSLVRAALLLKVPPFRMHVDAARVLLLGVREAHRGRGLEALIIHRIIESCLEMGMTSAEMSWILEDNEPMKRILGRMGADQYRTYRILEKGLTGQGEPPPREEGEST